MQNLREEQRVGLASVETATTLLQRIRGAHPTKGLYEAAELQWFWSVPRSTDDLGQPFWFDDGDQPVAAVVMADFTGAASAIYEEVTFSPLFMPDATPALIAHIVERGLDLARDYGFKSVELEVDRTDEVMREVLVARDFTMTAEDALNVAWVSADARAEVSPLHDGYQLSSRSETAPRAHHMNERNPAFVEERLIESSLYRPELDLVVIDKEGDYAGYGLFWFDPTTGTGCVEPMRTKDEHQQRGLARHILTAGIDMLAQAGAQRINIGYEPDNPASGHLYRSVGFKDVMTTDMFSGPTGAAAS